MKSTIQKNYPDVSYPILMQHMAYKYIVLFSDAGKGTLVITGLVNVGEVGFYNDSWRDQEFEFFSGEVLISNI